MKKIGAILSWLVVGVILTVALTLAVSNFNTPIGLRVFAILSGSMDPNLSTGSLVITKNQSSYTVGDIVTIRSERSAKENVTHRISEIEIDDSGNIRYQLKGDANENPDREMIRDYRVVGKVIAHVPYLGRLVGFAQTQTGFIALIIIPGVLVVYNEIMNIKKEIQKILKDKKNKNLHEKTTLSSTA